MREKLKSFKKKFLIYGGLIAIGVTSFHIADKYFNRDSAEENLKEHVYILYSKYPDAVKCANVDTSNYDSRVTCEAMIDGKPHTYLCKGFLDGLDKSCIAPKFSNKL